MGDPNPQLKYHYIERTVAQGLPALPDKTLQTGTLCQFEDAFSFAILRVDGSGNQQWVLYQGGPGGGGGGGGGDFIRYLKPLTGKDDSDGLTPATAWKTLDKVKQELPAMDTGKCRVFVVEAGTSVMPLDGIYVPIPINPQGQQFAGEGLVIDARGALVTTEVGRVVTADDPSGGTITYGGAALPRDTLIKITQGAAAGLYGTIRSTTTPVPGTNVSTMLIGFGLCGPGTFTNDTFDVVEQGYVVNMSAGGFFFGFPGLRMTFNLVATKILGGRGCGARGLIWSSPLCVIDTQGAPLSMAEREGSWGIASLPPDLDDGTTFLPGVVVSGVDGSGNGGSLNGNIDSEILAFLQATDTAIACERGSSLAMFHSLVNSPIINIQPKYHQEFGFAPFPGFDSDATGLVAGFTWNLDLESGTPSPTAAVRIAGGGAMVDAIGGSNASILGVRIEGNDGDGVQLADGALASMLAVTTDPLNKNTGAGAVVTNGAKLHYDDTTAVGGTPLTGANDSTLDGDIYTWAAIDAVAGAAAGLDANGNILSKKAVIDSRGSVIALDP